MRELTIDWAALHSAFQMNMPEVRCFFATEDGRVLKLPPGDPALGQVKSDPQHFIAIEAIPSRIQYQWLDDFIHGISEENVRGRMEAAINGKGAFRRFKDILLSLPDERRRWFEFRDQMMRRRIVDWVHEQGIEPINPAPWLDDPNYIAHTSILHDHESNPNESLAGGVAHSSMTGAFEHESYAPQVRQSSAEIPDNVGNVASAHAPMKTGRHTPVQNAPQEVEALRDFLIEWSDERGQDDTPGPLELEELAGRIAKHFYVKSAHA